MSESDPYASRQMVANAEHRQDFATWFSSLPEDQKEALRRQKIDSGGASYTVFKTDVGDMNLEESSAASVSIDMGTLDPLHAQLMERYSIPESVARAIALWHMSEVEREAISYKAFLLQRLIGGFLLADNPKLSAAGLAYAAGLATLNGMGSQAKYARLIGVTRAAVSKMTKFWSRQLELRPSSFMKSAEACEKYAQIGKTKHWRNKKYERGK